MWACLADGLSVIKKGVYEIKSRLGVMQACAQCTRLIKTKGLNTTSQDTVPGRPIIEWLWSYPHKCVFETLQKVQTMYIYGWLDRDTFERWMEMNTAGYQVGKNNKLLLLWRDRLPPLDDAKARLRRVGHAGLREPSTLDNIKAPGFKKYTCNIGGRHEHVKIIWKAVGSRQSVKSLNILFPWSSDADKSHTNLDVASLVWWASRSSKEPNRVREGIDKALRLLACGLSNITVAAWLIAMAGLKHCEKMYDIAMKDGACGLGPEEYPNYWKACSVALRRTSRWPDGSNASLDEVASCAYFELPIGRSQNVSDWEEEQRKRTKEVVNLRPVDWVGDATDESNRAYLRELRPILDGIMNELISGADVWPSWAEMVERRQSWVSSGSSGGARLVIDGKPERLNKQAYFETVSAVEMNSWPDREPKIEAVASEKFEMGKGRAIYGTKPVDYAIMSYVIGSSERKLWRVDGVESGLSGLDEVMCIVRRAKEASIPNVECTMIDYADFNYQHTLGAQSAVFDALRDRMGQIGAHSDVVRCADWCAKALLNQWCTFPNSKKPVRITQGMFSGCRGTNFLNTVLNVAYMRLAVSNVSRLLQLHAVNLYTVHQGDDVWVSNGSRLWAAGVYLTLQRCGLIFQAGKQMFDQRRGEFLRVVYTEEGARGYPLRAIGTLIMNPLQSTDVHSPQDRAAGLTSQIHLLHRRGVSEECCAWLWDSTVRHALAVKLPQGAGVAIPLRVAAASVADGGLDLGPPGRMGVRTEPIAVLPRLELHTRSLEEAVPKLMSADWIKYMSSQVQEEMDSERVMHGLHRANVSGSLRTVDKLAGMRRFEKDLRRWVSGLGASTGSVWGCLGTEPPDEGRLSTAVAYRLGHLKEPKCRKQGWERRGLIDTILAAIASGPFRDINTVQKAMNLGIVEAAKYAISLSSSPRLRVDAYGLLAGVEMSCGKEVLARVLSGVGGVSRPWEAVFNPIILSWASKCAADLAIYDAMGKGIRSSSEWDRELRSKQNIVLRMLVRDGQLVQLSHF